MRVLRAPVTVPSTKLAFPTKDIETFQVRTRPTCLCGGGTVATATTAPLALASQSKRSSRSLATGSCHRRMFCAPMFDNERPLSAQSGMSRSVRSSPSYDYLPSSTPRRIHSTQLTARALQLPNKSFIAFASTHDSLPHSTLAHRCNQQLHLSVGLSTTLAAYRSPPVRWHCSLCPCVSDRHP